MDQQTGKFILIAGLLIVVAGTIIYFFHDYFKWIGRLPGDIRIEKQNFRFYFPFTTMILFSIVLTILIQIIRRIF